MIASSEKLNVSRAHQTL